MSSARSQVCIDGGRSNDESQPLPQLERDPIIVDCAVLKEQQHKSFGTLG